MMGTEMVPETLDFNELTRLSAREEFINFSRRESFTSYKLYLLKSLLPEATKRKTILMTKRTLLTINSGPAGRILQTLQEQGGASSRWVAV
jgi:hypothetical protein